MRFHATAVTDVGSVRSENQDAVLANDSLAVVADGMGGHRGGEVAASLAVAVLDDGGTTPTIEALLDLARQANREVFERSLLEPQFAGMGTTLCAVAPLPIDPPSVGIINVGDSRVYLLDAAGLRQLSEDHSFVETLVREGRLTPAQAEVHPQRNVLTRALGIETDVLVDAWVVECREGDRYLLCSDGLFNEVTDAAIEEVLRDEADPDRAANELVRLAVANGGRDNVSCVIADVSEVSPVDPMGERQVVRFSGVPATASASEVPVETDGETAASDQRPFFTWRVGLLLLSLAAILAVAAATVAYLGQRGEWVGIRDGEVTAFRGNPSGVLWVQPSRTGSGIFLEQITSTAEQARLCTDRELDSAAAVEGYLDTLREQIRRDEGDATTVSGPSDCEQVKAGFFPPATASTTTVTAVTTTSIVAETSEPDATTPAAGETAPVTVAPPGP